MQTSYAVPGPGTEGKPKPKQRRAWKNVGRQCGKEEEGRKDGAKREREELNR